MLDIHQIQPIAQRHHGRPVRTEVRDDMIYLLLIFPTPTDRDAFLRATREASQLAHAFPATVTAVVTDSSASHTTAEMAVELPFTGAEVFAPPPIGDEGNALWEAHPYAAGTRVQVSSLMARYLTDSELLSAAAHARLNGMSAQVMVYAGELLRRLTDAAPTTSTTASDAVRARENV